MNPRRALISVVAAAIALAVFAGGGFDPVPRLLFASLSGGALLLALYVGPESAARAARQPVVLALLGLALLTGVSVSWTIAETGEAIRWALSVAGYAALAMAAAVAASDRAGIRALAAIICVVAGAAAILGLVAVVLRAEPMALRLGGSWRPAGPFEYPPALALLQVSALPALLAAMVRPPRAIAAGAALGLALAAEVLALSGSGLQLALGGAVAVLALARPELVGIRQRAPLAAALALAVAAGGIAAASGGDAVLLTAEAGRALPVLVPTLILPLAWFSLKGRPRLEGSRETAPGHGRGPRPRRLVVVAGVIAMLGLGVAALAEERQDPRSREGQSGAAHGRLALWGDAVDTAADRPIAGWGAESFALASAGRQGGNPVRYAHNLPLELWVELGLVGFALGLVLYLGSAVAIWRARGTEAAWLLGPAVTAFLLASLLDWPWHLAGAGAVWALCLGGLLAARTEPIPPERSQAGHSTRAEAVRKLRGDRWVGSVERSQ